MPGAQHITVKSLPGISPEQARATRAKAWLYVFGCFHQNQGGTRLGAPNDGTKSKENSADEHVIQ